MTEAPSRGAFETDERFDIFEDTEASGETERSDTPRDRQDAATLLERLRALEAFSAA